MKTMLKLCGVVVLIAFSFSKVKAQTEFIQQFVSTDSISRIPLTDSKGRSSKYFPTTELTAFVFLSPECPICKNYSKTLNELNGQWKQQVTFVGIVPGKSYSRKDINSFADSYKISFPLYTDKSFAFSKKLQATTTPEVVLIDKTGKILYRGAIDNWFVDLGKNRSKPTSNYLESAISQSLSGQTVLIHSTKPVGCLINDF
jgi:peroxiredoxin